MLAVRFRSTLQLGSSAWCYRVGNTGLQEMTAEHLAAEHCIHR